MVWNILVLFLFFLMEVGIGSPMPYCLEYENRTRSLPNLFSVVIHGAFKLIQDRVVEIAF
jgi:hypothetical protein